MLQEEWKITGIRISSRSSADVYYGDKTVRIAGEVMTGYFLAYPYEMFWLEKEDRETWPWNLPEEKRNNKLSETERSAVMESVNDFFRNKKDPIIFLTKEMEERSLELADRIRDKQLSRRKASVLLKNEFPILPDGFCKDMITDSLAGASWYNKTDTNQNLKEMLYMNGNDKESKKKNDSSGMVIGMSIGLSIGIAVGAATNNIGMWMSIGLCLGLALGSVFHSSDDSEDSGSDEKE